MVAAPRTSSVDALRAWVKAATQPAREPLETGIRSRWACLAVLGVGTIAAYSGTFSVPMLFDDTLSIENNTSIRGLWPVWRALHPPADAGVGGRPLLNLSFALNHALGGLDVAGYHAANLAVHVLASWVLFALVRRTLLRPALRGRFGAAATPLALAVAAIWAWHPLQTLSVTYLSQRAESLMGLFYLLTLYGFIRGAESDTGRGRLRWLSLSFLSCAAGACTKEVIVTAPFAVLLYDRTFVSGGFSSALRKGWGFYLSLAAALLPLCGRVADLHRGGVVYGVGFGVPWWGYALTECRVVLRYLLLCLWPSPLVLDYGAYGHGGDPVLWPFAVAVAALVAAAVVAVRRLPEAGFCAAWFFLVLAPTSSVIPIVGQPMAESRLYLPLAGAAALAVVGAFVWFGRGCLPFLGAVAVALGFLSAQRNRDFRSDVAIWSDTVAKVPGNARAHNNLGIALEKRPGREKDAIAQYEEALRINPDYALARNNLGNSLASIPGRLPEAIAQFQEAIRLDPGYAEAHDNLGNAWEKTPGRRDQAIAEYREALRLQPTYAEAHSNLGDALARIPGREAEALAEYREALRLMPDFEPARMGLGALLLRPPGPAHPATPR
jgi:Flp pilus assembly protein TadD/uncharacterized membrane protein YhaH (DUF805 family)